MTEKVTINNDELAVVAKVTSVVDDDIKASAPVRVYVCQPGGTEFEYTGHWGVAAVILDPANNGLFISIVSLQTKEIILKQEVYDPFTFSFPTSNFQTFEADEFTVGLCFAEGYDAKYFYMTVQGMVNYVKHSAKQASTPAPAKTNTPTPKKPEPAKEQPAQKKFSLTGLFKKKEEPVKSRPVIGKPKNFQHVSHIGFNSKEGFSEIPPQWKEIFRKAGISEEELKDKKTAKFLMKTIVHSNEGNLPPPPTSGGGPPPPPPPSMGGGGGPPPPPPPPPPTGGMPTTKIATAIPQSEHSSGGGGGAPRGVPQDDKAGVGSSVDLLEQIRQGTKLKKVTIEDIPDVEKMDEHETDSLANNIARAMEARRKVVVESDSDDDDDDWEL